MVEKFSFRFGQLTISKFLHFAVFPMLTGFMLDLPWTTQALVSFAFACASLFVGDFVEALLTLWQAVAVSGVVFLIIDIVLGPGVNPLLAALSILVSWIFIILMKFSRGSPVDEKRRHITTSDFIGVLLLCFTTIKAPHGKLEAFGFLAVEDNERWLTSIIKVLRGDELSLNSSFDSYSVQYFTKFFLNGFLFLSRLSFEFPQSSLLSIEVLSNAWSFALITFILLTLRVASKTLKVVAHNENSLFLLLAVGIQSVLFFRASHDFGHFPQYLLNVTVLAFVTSIIDWNFLCSRVSKIFNGLILVSISFSIVGSYNPWLPISISCLFITANLFLKDTFFRRLLRSRKLPAVLIVSLLIGIFVFSRLSNKYSGLDDGGGVWSIPMEGVWFVWLVFLMCFAKYIRMKFAKSTVSRVQQFVDDEVFSKKYTLVAIATAVIWFADFPRNQEISLALVLLLGVTTNRFALEHLFQNIKTLADRIEFDGVLILGFVSFSFAFLIYSLSRFVGPIYEPMYAANKSMLTVFGQFSWLPLILIISRNQQIKRSALRARELVTAFLFAVVIGIFPYFKYNEIKHEWWLNPVVTAVGQHPDAIVVCVNSDWRLPSYDVYTCNRYLQTLTSIGEPASAFRYLAWYRPGNYEIISDWFEGPFKSFKNMKVIVLSRGYLTEETRQIFKHVKSNNIEFRNS